jgi:hypothetical protein
LNSASLAGRCGELEMVGGGLQEVGDDRMGLRSRGMLLFALHGTGRFGQV